MIKKHEGASIGDLLVVIVVIINVIIIRTGFIVNPKWYCLLLISAPLLVLIGLFRRRSPDRK